MTERQQARTLRSALRFIEGEYECLVGSVCRIGEQPNATLSNVDWANRSLVRRYQRMLAKIRGTLGEQLRGNHFPHFTQNQPKTVEK